jgi:hypothetical protein
MCEQFGVPFLHFWLIILINRNVYGKAAQKRSREARSEISEMKL